MSIVIGGDLVPTKENESFFYSGELNALFDERLNRYFESVDYKIINLECPITDRKEGIKKCGAHFSANEQLCRFFKTFQVDLLSLANNHIMDYGAEGLNDTIDALKDNGLAFVGAGKNEEEAARPFCFHHNGKKFCVISCAEHEFSIATADSAGAYGYDEFKTNLLISRFKQQADYLIVLYHGGKEYYRYPSPALQKRCRAFVDSGADLVVCQHSHCIGAEEIYTSKRIVYGQGNFIFHYSNSECWKTGLLIEIDNELRVKYVPLIQTECGIGLANDEDATQIMNDFRERSRKITEKGFLEKEFKSFSDSMIVDYLEVFSGNVSLVRRVLFKLFGAKYRDRFFRSRYSSKRVLQLRNYLNCESHLELIRAGLENYDND